MGLGEVFCTHPLFHPASYRAPSPQPQDWGYRNKARLRGLERQITLSTLYLSPNAVLMATITHSHDHDHFQPPIPRKRRGLDILAPLRKLVDAIEVKNVKFGHFLCQLIPCTCVFERDVTLFGRKFHVPALCKLNPLYDEFVGLRFRALSYLADAGEDVNKYIC